MHKVPLKHCSCTEYEDRYRQERRALRRQEKIAYIGAKSSSLRKELEQGVDEAAGDGEGPHGDEEHHHEDDGTDPPVGLALEIGWLALLRQVERHAAAAVRITDDRVVGGTVVDRGGAHQQIGELLRVEAQGHLLQRAATIIGDVHAAIVRAYYL